MWHIGTVPGDDGRTVRDENGLEVARFSSVEDAKAAAAAPALLTIAADMLAYQAAQFDAVCIDCNGSGKVEGETCGTCEGEGHDHDRDLSVSGADLVDAFAEWRGQLKRAVGGEA